jgi:hypothetical protein
MNLRGNISYVDIKYTALANELGLPYKELYGQHTELGKWLRTKNSLIVINNNLFTHAGISRKFLDLNLSIEETNRIIQNNLGRDNRHMCFMNETACFLFGREGLMWYRGYFGDYKDHYSGITEKDLNLILERLGIEHIIVGHTTVEKVTSLYNNKVIAIDVLNKSDPRRENDTNLALEMEGLLILNGNYYRLLNSSMRELLFTKNNN